MIDPRVAKAEARVLVLVGVLRHVTDAMHRLVSVLDPLDERQPVLGDACVRLLDAQKPRRFNELKRLIGGVSQQMLTRTLKALERDGMVTRQVYPTVPPQVEYGLTALGQSLSVPVMHLAKWVLEHLDEIERHRDDHDCGRP